METTKPSSCAEPSGLAAKPGAGSAAGAGKWPVLDLTPADAPDVCELFERVFGQPMSLAFHAWKYADGRGHATAMRDDAGRLVAHYGGTLRVMQWGAHRFTGAQVGDVMVAAEVRDVFARFGPFGRVARQFIQQYLGPERPYPIGFGFPSARHVLLGRRLGLYWPVTQVWSWSWSRAGWAALGVPVSLGSGWREMSMDAAADRACVDAWADEMAQDFAALNMLWPVRTGDWWRHRYTNHPHNRYRVLTMASSDADDALGAWVVKVPEGGGAWELMDWVGPVAFSAQVLGHAAAVAARDPSCTGLEMWCTEAVAACLPPDWTAAAHQAVACEVVVNGDHVLGQPVGPLKQSFWLTGGDTDFH